MLATHLHAGCCSFDRHSVSRLLHTSTSVAGGCSCAVGLLLLLADEDNQHYLSILLCSQPGLLLPAYEAAPRCLATVHCDAEAYDAHIAA
jgi:hypothetical protein